MKLSVYNFFVNTQDYCLVNFLDAYYTSELALFHDFQTQSGGGGVGVAYYTLLGIIFGRL